MHSETRHQLFPEAGNPGGFGRKMEEKRKIDRNWEKISTVKGRIGTEGVEMKKPRNARLFSTLFFQEILYEAIGFCDGLIQIIIDEHIIETLGKRHFKTGAFQTSANGFR